MFKYIRFSNLKFSVDLNPFVWSFKFHHQGPTLTDPCLNIFYLRILPLSIALIIDNGEWASWEDSITPTTGTGSDLI